jgi:hypothetical protein
MTLTGHWLFSYKQRPDGNAECVHRLVTEGVTQKHTVDSSEVWAPSGLPTPLPAYASHNGLQVNCGVSLMNSENADDLHQTLQPVV